LCGEVFEFSDPALFERQVKETPEGNRASLSW
jgi:hypothetical protein